ncbi:MAG TPA: AMP phosphorylase [Nitrososphaeraceae archaeon]|nr:AMP phosphorylase [Nitrososphaeraceae archaeon]
MKFKAKILGIESGGRPVITLSKDDAYELGIRSGERVKLLYENKEMIVIVNIVTKSVPKGIAGIYDELRTIGNIKESSVLEIEVIDFPQSIYFIQNKLKKSKLNYKEIFEIIKDVVNGNLNEFEIAAFLTALDHQGLDIDEATSLTLAMVETGKKLEIANKPICDKHSIGGVPGDKTTLLVVPIIAAAGLTIPKTSSRAITSASGTADRAEILMPVNLTTEHMKMVIEKTNGCIVWGGSLELAPADDKFIQVEYPLSIDPLLLPSIMAKKKAVGANYLVLDIPSGRGTKVKTTGDADLMAKEFMELGKRLEIKTQSIISFGEQPIGNTIGPALEAREALEVLQGSKVPDLIDKAINICGLIFSMAGIGGKNLALDILKSGKAEKKMKEIIYRQGGDSEVHIEDIKIGDHKLEIQAVNSGNVLWLDNNIIVTIARLAGAPKDKGAGIIIHKKIGQKVKKDDKLLTIYSEKKNRIHSVEKMLTEIKPIQVGNRHEMIIHTFLDIPEPKKTFILER